MTSGEAKTNDPTFSKRANNQRSVHATLSSERVKPPCFICVVYHQNLCLPLRGASSSVRVFRKDWNLRKCGSNIARSHASRV